MRSMMAGRSKRSRRQGVWKSRHSARLDAAARSRSVGRSFAPGSPKPPAERRLNARRSPSGGSVRDAWSQASKACPKTGAESASTSKRGSTLASTGRSRNRSAQKPWMVLTWASSRWAMACSTFLPPPAPPPAAVPPAGAGAAPCPGACRARSSPSRRRSFSSPAAFSVNVTARISPTSAAPVASTLTMRVTSSDVFPVPAAASTRRLSSSDDRMRSRAAASTKSGSVMTRGLAGRRLSRQPPQRLQVDQLRVVLAPGAHLLPGAAHHAVVAPGAGAPSRGGQDDPVLDRPVDDR